MVTLPHLSSEIVPFPPLGGLPAMLLPLTPTTNGEGTITITLALIPMDDPDAPHSALVAQDAELLATVNVGSGETFAIALTKGESAMTILIEPTVLPTLSLAQLWAQGSMKEDRGPPKRTPNLFRGDDPNRRCHLLR